MWLLPVICVAIKHFVTIESVLLSFLTVEVGGLNVNIPCLLIIMVYKSCCRVKRDDNVGL